MKKDIRLYNVLFPIWILMFWPTPPIILITIFGNLVIDCLVLCLALRGLKHPRKKEVVKEMMWAIWGRGFLADLVGALWLTSTAVLLNGILHPHLNILRPWSHPLAFLWTLSGVAVAGVCIYFFDKKAMKETDLLTDRERHIIALTMAIVTAPWLFLVPLYW